MMLERNFTLKARFKLRILNADRSLKYESPDWIPNLITDIGMDRIGAGFGLGAYLRIGTGTATPTNADTQLQSQSASTASAPASGGTPSQVNAGAPNYETICTRTWEFALGAVVGNMAEIGTGSTDSSASTLNTHARIVDGGGSPTTITVLSTEILQVTYQLIVYPQTTDSTGTVDISGETYNYVSRIYNASSAMAGWEWNNGPLGFISQATAYGAAATLSAITGTGASGGGTPGSLAGGSFASYTNGTYYRDFTLTAAIGAANVTGGIGAINIMMSSSGPVSQYSQISFSPAIPKDNTKTLSLTFRTSWARH